MSTVPHIAVSRDYRPDPECCAHALELLLKSPVSKEGGPTTAPKEDVKESNGYVATPNHSR